MSSDYAGLLKIGKYIETEASEDTAARCCHDNSFVYEIVASLCLPLHYLSMPDVNAASDCVGKMQIEFFLVRPSKTFLKSFLSPLFLFHLLYYIIYSVY